MEEINFSEAINSCSIVCSTSIVKPIVYLSIDNKVIVEELETLSTNWNKPVIIVVCVRLGTKHVNEVRNF